MTVFFKSSSHGSYGEKEKIETHESFGMVSITTPSGGCPNLFGSSIKHSNKIALEIHEAEKRRDLHREWYYPVKPIIRVEMSKVQFAELITSVGTQGVPVTITRREYTLIEDCPEQSTRTLYEQEFKEDLNEVMDDMSEDFKLLKDMLNSGNMKMGERKAAAGMLTRIEQALRSNLPFIQSSFNEAVDKTVVAAKGEVEAFFEGKIRQLGLEEYKSQVKKNFLLTE